jgi:signal transduction histidine kinase
MGVSRTPLRLGATTSRQQFLDGLVAGVLLVLAEASTFLKTDHANAPRWVIAILGVVAVLPLAWRRRAPLVVWAVSGGAAFVALAQHGTPGLLAFGPLVAVYTVATLSPRRVSLLAGATTLVGVTVGIALGRPNQLVWEAFVFPAVVIAACWLVGDNLRVRRAYVAELEAKSARADSDRETASTRAAEEERARIARELHDVVVHHVSVIAVQAGAARMNAEHGAPPADSVQALRAVETSARTALGELRQLLGILRHEDEPPALAPQPGLDQLDRLLDDVRRTGLPVAVRIEGEPRGLPAAVDLSAYRIVQEALTNALRHGGAAPALVVVRYGVDHLEIEVTDEGRGVPAAVPAGAATTVGHGLVGMRERVSIFGGEFDAGPRPEGGFGVSARIPIPGSPG